jgi:hypothetical protein
MEVGYMTEVLILQNVMGNGEGNGKHSMNHHRTLYKRHKIKRISTWSIMRLIKNKDDYG